MARRFVSGSVAVLLTLGATSLATAPAQAGSGDGTAIGWGGTGAVPDSLSGKDVIDVSSFDGHNLALTSDGQVTAWGDNTYGQTDVPASLADEVVTSVAAGCNFSLALTANGQVTAWGVDTGKTEVPAPLADKAVTAISAGCSQALVLTSDGQVTAWGDDGQAAVPATLADKTVTAIDAAFNHALVVTSDGRVTAWGDDTWGQSTVPASLDDQVVTAVAGGLAHSVALTADGQVTAWGDNSRNQRAVPALHGETVIDIEASVWHSLALTATGNVIAWGHNGQCQLCVPALPAETGYTAISVGHLHSLGVRAPLPIDFTTGTTATITGTPRAGQVLTAGAGQVAPAPDSYVYRWFADGSAIPGATGANLVLTASQRGTEISVQVTSLKHGYHDSADTSEATTVVTRGEGALVVTAPTRLMMGGRSAWISTRGLEAGEDYTIRMGGSQVATGTAPSTGPLNRRVTLPRFARDRRVAVVVTGSESDRTGRTTTRILTKKTLGSRITKRVRATTRQRMVVTGLAGGERVTVKYRGNLISAPDERANADGVYRFSFRVGKLQGVKTLRATGEFPARTSVRTFKVTRR